MTGATLSILSPGLLTTVQDLGRWGHQNQGVPVAGPMDPFAHRAANAMVGNDPAAAALEVTLLGPAITCSETRRVAVAGAAFDMTVDGRPADDAEPITLPAGAVLRFERRVAGTRAYLAIAGGIDVPRVLGSRATHLMTRMGGLDGRALRAGDNVTLGRATAHGAARRRPRAYAIDTPAVIRVLAGPQDDRFAADTLDRLQSAPYLVTTLSDRTGYRLEGPRLAHRASADIISDATPLGSIQVPGSGQPILLMADRQTSGGYPKVATVISADLRVAGQLAPGDIVRFRICSTREALAALIAQEQELLALGPLGAEPGP